MHIRLNQLQRFNRRLMKIPSGQGACARGGDAKTLWPVYGILEGIALVACLYFYAAKVNRDD